MYINWHVLFVVIGSRLRLHIVLANRNNLDAGVSRSMKNSAEDILIVVLGGYEDVC